MLVGLLVQQHPGVVHLVQVLGLCLLEDDLPLVLDFGNLREVNQPLVLEGHLRAKDGRDPTFLSDLSLRPCFTLVLARVRSDPFYPLLKSWKSYIFNCAYSNLSFHFLNNIRKLLRTTRSE